MFFKANFRKISSAIIIGIASVLPIHVFAIGLGEIQLNSSLNEPLNAEIQLLQVKGLSANEILVGIAPKADFEAAGVDRLFFLSSLKFSLELDNPKGPRVRIRTDAPVREPYLNFLLQVQWPSGRLLREYTLLMDISSLTDSHASPKVIKGTEAPAVQQKPKSAPMDVQALEAELAEVDAQSAVAPASAPPVIAPAAVPQAQVQTEAPVAGDTTQAQAVTSEPTPVAEPPAPVSAEPAAAEEMPVEAVKPAEEPVTAVPGNQGAAVSQTAVVPVYSSTPAEGDYSVQKGDNLWSIAMKYRQDNTVSVQQSMLAIQRLNPQAFIQGNINLLKKGKVLRMPTYDELTDITSREAVAEVRRQNVAWSGNADGHKNAANAAVEQIDATRQSGTAVEVPADTEEGHLKLSVPGSAEGSAVGKASGADAGAKEALQNELSISMEELDRNKREKSVVADKLSGLNDQANTMQQMLDVRNAELAALQAALAKKQQAKDETPVEPAASVGTTTTEVGVQPAPSAAQTVAPAAGTEVKPVETTPKPVAEEPAKQSQSKGILGLIQDNLIWLAGGLLTLVLIIFAAIKLRNRKPKTDFSSQDEEVDAHTDSNILDLDTASDEHDDVADAAQDSLELDEDLFEEAPVEAKPETSDAIGEADIYISFGTYDKAESLLKNAINSEPKRTDLRLKLLEVYVGMENLKDFDKQLEEVTKLGDRGAIERAREMRNRISGASSDDTVSTAQAAVSPADSLDFDLDLSDDTSLAESTGDLDFDLDLDLDEEPKEDSTQKSQKVNISDAPTVQQRAIDISEMQTAVTPAVKAAEARTAMRESIDLDLSGLDEELKEFDSIPDTVSTAVYDAVANDAPTPKTDLDEEFDFLADADESATKLDLARAYIDMGDKEGAKDILQEVIEEGQDTQKNEARKLLAGIS
jgi:pilus assembly protein FimV